MLHTPIAEEALSDQNLYDTAIEHRKTFIGLKGFDYSTLSKPTLTFIPPESVRNEWKKDCVKRSIPTQFKRLKNARKE